MATSAPVGLRAAPLLWALCALAACSDGRDPESSGINLLHGRKPLRVVGVDHAERLNDGVTPAEGDHWLTDLSVVYRDASASVVYDLGQVTAVQALFLSGDNNDDFHVALSDDGRGYRALWRSGRAREAGMRARWITGLQAQGRYLRLTARGGDPFVSIGELMAFARAPEPWPPEIARTHGGSPNDAAERWLLAACAALVLLVALGDRRLPRAVPIVAAVVAACTFAVCARLLAQLWPLPGELISHLRALLAGVAICTLLVVTFARPRRGLPATVLSVVALISVACFYNFGRPWFWNRAEDRPTFVHLYDMRVYFPVAKYFPELGFEGVYVASIAAYLEGERLPAAEVANVELRDLRDNRMVRARELAAEVTAAPRAFGAERWQSFVADMRFFWKTMGKRDYLGSLGDHGGNATPAWLAVAHLLFRGAGATERNLTLAALLDPLLLLVTFAAIARLFGLRAMLVCMIVFGTSDFPMFGSNWAGSTLRFDWMAAIGLGACALRAGRPALGGALLAYAGLVRAFPAFALAFALLPAAIALCEHGLARAGVAAARALPSPELRAHMRALLRMLAGAAATVLVLVSLSTTLFGFERSWGSWLEKIELHTEKANTNHIGVRTVMAFDPEFTVAKVIQPELAEPWARWQETQLATYERRAPPAFALRLLFCMLCVLACRRAPREHAALIGLLLIPVLFYPANYYLHYVFLLPLLAVGRQSRSLIEVLLLAIGVAQLFTLGGAVDLRFFAQSAIVLCAWLLLLGLLVVEALRGARAATVEAAPEPA